MKRMVSFLLALLFVGACFRVQSVDAKAFGEVWVKEYYKDKFGDVTDEYCLTNKSQFKGTYNSDRVNGGKLGAYLIFERDGEKLLAFLTLFLNGTDQVKHSTFLSENYEISVKRADGREFDTSGKMMDGENRIQINSSIDLINAICDSDGPVKIYVEEAYNKNNNYLFTANCDNLGELFEKEIVSPYKEEKNELERDPTSPTGFRKQFLTKKENGAYRAALNDETHDKTLVWIPEIEDWYDEDSDCYLWYNNKFSVWQYWYEGISSDYGDFGWMEHDDDGWYIEVSQGNWIILPAKYDTDRLWYIDINHQIND